MSRKSSIRIFEVGPRDGLQNEPRKVSVSDKAWFISSLVSAGVREMEVGAFVRPDRVPQMADTDEVYSRIRSGKVRLGPAHAWALVPNREGLERAQKAGVEHIAVFTAATDGFTKRNIGMTVAESLREYAFVVREAKASGISVRGYVSTAFGCPFEGKVSPAKALRVVEKLADLGVEQVSIGDTIGVATPNQVNDLVGPALRTLKAPRVAVHFHDTRGTALANALRALELGVTSFDSSAGGLGGCPFAPGATGNLATEDLLYMFEGMGIRTGISLPKLARTSLELAHRMKRPISSRYLLAFRADCAG